MNDETVPKPAQPAEGYAIRVYPIDESEEVRLVDLWRVAWSGKWWIAGAALAGAVLVTALGFLITPVYRAEAVLKPVSTDRSGGALSGLVGQLGGLASIAGLNLGADDSSAQAIAVLRSRALTERFIEKNGLLPMIFHEDWDPVRKAWDVDDPTDVPTPWKAYERFDRRIRSVVQDAETGLVTLSIDWIDPNVARDWANALVAEVNEEMRTRAIQQSRKNIEFLQGQLRDTNEVELRTAAFSLMEAEMKNAMLSAVRTEYAFEVIDPAVAPERMHWPNRILLAVVGFFAGMAAGVVFVFARRAARGG